MIEQIKQILKQIRPELIITEQSDLIDTLDSLDIINLVATLEEEFVVSIHAHAITPENFKNLSAIEQLIESSEKK